MDGWMKEMAWLVVHGALPDGAAGLDDLRRLQACVGRLSAVAPMMPALAARARAAARQRAHDLEIEWGEALGDPALPVELSYRPGSSEAGGAPWTVVPALRSGGIPLSGAIRLHRLTTHPADALAAVAARRPQDSEPFLDLAAWMEGLALLGGETRPAGQIPQLPGLEDRVGAAIDRLEEEDVGLVESIGRWWVAAGGAWIDAAALQRAYGERRMLAGEGVDLALGEGPSRLYIGTGGGRPARARLGRAPRTRVMYDLALGWRDLVTEPGGPWTSEQRRLLESGWLVLREMGVQAVTGAPISWAMASDRWREDLRSLTGRIVGCADAVVLGDGDLAWAPGAAGWEAVQALQDLWAPLRELLGPVGRALPERMFPPVAALSGADRRRCHDSSLPPGLARLVDVRFGGDEAIGTFDIGGLPRSALLYARLRERLNGDGAGTRSLAEQPPWASPLPVDPDAERERLDALIRLRDQRWEAQRGWVGLLELADWTEILDQQPERGSVEVRTWHVCQLARKGLASLLRRTADVVDTPPREQPAPIDISPPPGDAAGELVEAASPPTSVPAEADRARVVEERLVVMPDGSAILLRQVDRAPPWVELLREVLEAVDPMAALALGSELHGDAARAGRALVQAIEQAGERRDRVIDALEKVAHRAELRELGVGPVVHDPTERPDMTNTRRLAVVDDRALRQEVEAGSWSFGQDLGLCIGADVVRRARPVWGPDLSDGVLRLLHEGWRTRRGDPSPVAQRVCAAWESASRGGLDHLQVPEPLPALVLRALEAVIDAETEAWVGLRDRFLRGGFGWVLVAAEEGTALAERFWPCVDPATRARSWSGLRRDGAAAPEIRPRILRPPNHPPPPDLLAAVAVRDALDAQISAWVDPAWRSGRPREVGVLADALRKVISAVRPVEYDAIRCESLTLPRVALVLLRSLDVVLVAGATGDADLAEAVVAGIEALDASQLNDLGVEIVLGPADALAVPERGGPMDRERDGLWTTVAMGEVQVKVRAWLHDRPLRIPGLRFTRPAAFRSPPRDQPPRLVLSWASAGAPAWVGDLWGRLEGAMSAIPFHGSAGAVRVALHTLVEPPFPSAPDAARLARVLDEVDAAGASGGADAVAGAVLATLRERFGWEEVVLEVGKPAPVGAWDPLTSRVPESRMSDSPRIDRVLERAFQCGEAIVRRGRIEVAR